MNSSHSDPAAGACSCWLPLIPPAAVQTPPAAFQERVLKEADGYFLANAPCRHLRGEETAGSGIRKWGYTIYGTRPATCRDFCGKTPGGWSGTSYRNGA